MDVFFSPQSIAVIGGGNDTSKPGGRVVWNLARGRFPHLSVVNPRDESVQGLPTFKRIEDLPEAADLAIISIPAAQVVKAVQLLGARGTRGFIVLSAGFGETDEAGRELENRLKDEVVRAGAQLIGPNSLGVFTPGYQGTFGGPTMNPVPGTIDFISASGSTAAFIMEAGLERGLQFASLVSVGNSALCGVEDVLAFQDQNPQRSPVKTTLLYLESIREPASLLRHARSIRARGCHVVALKAGTTEAGARAASSHTGAMATRDAAVSALFDKAGVVRVRSGVEMVNVAGLLTCYGRPRGRRVGVITQAGGPGIMVSDELSRRGFEIPQLSSTTQQLLRDALMPGSATGNPIDFLAAATASHIRETFRILREHECDNLDALCVIFGSPGLFDVWPAYEAILEGVRSMPVPVYPILPSVRTAAEEARRLSEAGYFHFTSEVEFAVALDRVMSTPVPRVQAAEPPAMDKAAIGRVLREARAAGTRHLGQAPVEVVLRGCGFEPPPSEVAADETAAVEAAGRIGFPVVLKALGLLHKSDQHGVITDVRSEAEVRSLFASIRGIPGVHGVLVQRQVKGLEVIVGLSREGEFGHLVLVGIGGIFAEAIADTSVGLAPLCVEEATRMLGRLRGTKLLDGPRGRPAVDRAALAQAIVRLSYLAHEFPEIVEMDINPLIVTGADLHAVDARIEIG